MMNAGTGEVGKEKINLGQLFGVDVVGNNKSFLRGQTGKLSMIFNSYRCATLDLLHALNLFNYCTLFYARARGNFHL